MVFRPGRLGDRFRPGTTREELFYECRRAADAIASARPGIANQSAIGLASLPGQRIADVGIVGALHGLKARQEWQGVDLWTEPDPSQEGSRHWYAAGRFRPSECIVGPVPSPGCFFNGLPGVGW